MQINTEFSLGDKVWIISQVEEFKENGEIDGLSHVTIEIPFIVHSIIISDFAGEEEIEYEVLCTNIEGCEYEDDDIVTVEDWMIFRTYKEARKFCKKTNTENGFSDERNTRKKG